MSIRQTILHRINSFCARTGTGRSAFGLAAVGDRAFIRQLEQGKPITLARIEKAEAYMTAHGESAGDVGVADVAQEPGEGAGGTDAGEIDGLCHGADDTRAAAGGLRDGVSPVQGEARLRAPTAREAAR